MNRNANHFRLIIIFGVWTLIGLLFATQAWVSRFIRGEAVAWINALAIWMVWAYIWALLTPIVLKVTQYFPLQRPHLLLRLSAHLISSVLIAVIEIAIFSFIAPSINGANVETTWSATFLKLLGATVLFSIPVYWLIVGVNQVADLMRLNRERELQTLQLETRLSEASLLILRSQLQPHFLFNALNTISVLMREDVHVANRVLIQLSLLLRRSLDSSKNQEVALLVEVELLEAYLAIEKARFEDRLIYSIDIDSSVIHAIVPSLILQPLVENAVLHGLAERDKVGRIKINVYPQDDMLCLLVQDNGIGININQHIQEGVGISNTKSRLALLYGEHSTFKLLAAPEGGTLVRLIIPLKMMSVE